MYFSSRWAAVIPLAFFSLILSIFMASAVWVKETHCQIGPDVATFNSAGRTCLHPACATKEIAAKHKEIWIKKQKIFFSLQRKKGEKDTNCTVEVFCGAAALAINQLSMLNSSSEHNAKAKNHFLKNYVQQTCGGPITMKSTEAATLLSLGGSQW